MPPADRGPSPPFIAAEDPVLHKSLTQFDGGHYDAKHHGSVVLIDGQEVAHLLRCCHCNGHFLNVKIPGKERGWCSRCAAPVCPDKRCDECLPFQEFLSNIEKGLPPGHKPIMAAVHGDVPVALLKG